jgi:hypothetical protein
MMMRAMGFLAALLAAGCATLDDSKLVPGQSTKEQVSALMGEPALVLKRPQGETHQYHQRYLQGPAMFVARIGADGRLLGIEQRLVSANIHAIKEGMRAEQVKELLGPPYKTSRVPRLELDAWEYPWRHMGQELRVLWVHVSDDGVVRRVVEMHDYERDPQNGD